MSRNYLTEKHQNLGIIFIIHLKTFFTTEDYRVPKYTGCCKTFRTNFAY